MTESQTGSPVKPTNPDDAQTKGGFGRLSSFLFYGLIAFYFGYGPYAIYDGWRQCKDAPPGIWGDAACKSPMKARPRLNLGREYQLHGWEDKAYDEYQAVIALTSSSAGQVDREIRLSAASNIALLLIKREAYEPAESILTQVLAEYPYFPPAEMMLSNLYLLTNRSAEAIAEVNHAFDGSAGFNETFSSIGGLHLTRGIAYMNLGQCDAANADFALARKIDPDIKTVPSCPAKEN